MIPKTVKVLAEFTFHVWLAPRARLFVMARLTVAADMSIPLAPLVRVPAPVMAMSLKAPATLMPPHDLEVPSVNPAPSEALFHRAMSPEPGEPLAPEPPDQTPAVAPVRSAPAPVLVAFAARTDPAVSTNKTTVVARWFILCIADFFDWHGRRLIFKNRNFFLFGCRHQPLAPPPNPKPNPLIRFP